MKQDTEKRTWKKVSMACVSLAISFTVVEIVFFFFAAVLSSKVLGNLPEAVNLMFFVVEILFAIVAGVYTFRGVYRYMVKGDGHSL